MSFLHLIFIYLQGTHRNGSLKNEDISLQQNVIFDKDLSLTAHNNGMEQTSGTVFENHGSDSSFSNLENAVRPKESESNFNHSADTGEKLRNDSVVILANYDTEPNPEITVENHVDKSSSSSSYGMIESVLSSREREKMKNNPDDLGENLKYNGVSSGEFLDIVGTIGDVTTKDDLENTLRESQTIEARDNEVKAFESMEDELERDEGITFDEILVLDASDLTSQKVIEDALKKCAEAQTNGDTFGEGAETNDIRSSGDNSEKSVEPVFENHDETASSSEDLENDSSVLTRERNDKKLLESEEDLNGGLVKVQQQHEVEMQELRMTLQDEYQKQVNILKTVLCFALWWIMLDAGGKCSMMFDDVES